MDFSFDWNILLEKTPPQVFSKEFWNIIQNS